MNKVIFRSKYTLLTVLSLISAGSLMSGAIRARADEHRPHQHDDIRIGMVKEDGSWIDTHSDPSREMILQNLYAHPDKSLRIHELEEHLSKILNDDNVKAYIAAISNELVQCPKESLKGLAIPADAVLDFIPEVGYQSESQQFLAFNASPYSNCNGELGFCAWSGSVQVNSEMNEGVLLQAYLTTVKTYFDRVHHDCSAGLDARKMVKDSAKLESPTLTEQSDPAVGL